MREDVSIHAPARGATKSSGYVARYAKFQFTRPRGARLAAITNYLYNVQVSIHAPARGATRVSVPVKGVLRFNSRAREGRDDGWRQPGCGEEVSIHAPARGATVATLAPFALFAVSIHAPARGATVYHKLVVTASSFNSRVGVKSKQDLL